MPVFASPARTIAFCVALMLAFVPHLAAAGTRLIMVTSDHCPFCQAWERDVGAVYDKSPYAPSLPLTRVDMGGAMPEDVVLATPVVGTPTFIVIRDDTEIDRQRGYDDAEMFWWWLSEHVVE